ncbi:ATP-binding protein [Paralimibaculum aggregatum]|nr:ATP-binding protein [Limibaculum sp. NKW23]
MAAYSSTLKRYLPKSLFWRAFLILVIPILALQVVVAFVFVRRHYDAVTEQMAGSVAREIGAAVQEVERASGPLEAERRLIALTLASELEMGFEHGVTVTPEIHREPFDFTAAVIAKTLRDRIGRPMALDFVAVRKQVDIRIGVHRGALLVVVPRGRVNPSNPHLLLVWMFTTALGLTVVAVIFLRNQVRPIRELARAAADFGRGRPGAFRPRGAEEVRRAGHAFLDMRRRIERQIGHRTLLLSGVSHDLRTPLTRMKLALAVAEPCPEIEEIGRDVAEMERMIESFLDYVRGEGEDLAEPVSPVALADEIAGDFARQGREIERTDRIEAVGSPLVPLKRSAMKRCLTNLVDNAATHGTRVRLTVRLTRKNLDFIVEDNGPGIPAEHREEVMRPFTRLDAARNQDAGSGVGLGLAIAGDIARGHGGTLLLEDGTDLGGLRAVVSLPR